MQSRRNFLKSLSLFTGTAALGLSSACKTQPAAEKKEVGIQLWTVRDELGDTLAQTLEALYVMGYSSIEAFGYDGRFYGIEAREFSKMCSDLGLKLLSTHTGITGENAQEYADIALNAGLEYLVLPSLMGRPRGTADDFRRAAEEMNRIGETCKKTGIKFGYHNHDFEFTEVDGELPYDILISETDPETVFFQPDFYFFAKERKDPLPYFRAFPGRFLTWHVKDLANDGSSCVVGNGSVDFATILENKELAGLEHIFVEQEKYAEGTPLQCAEQSLRYITKNLL